MVMYSILELLFLVEVDEPFQVTSSDLRNEITLTSEGKYHFKHNVYFFLIQIEQLFLRVSSTTWTPPIYSFKDFANKLVTYLFFNHSIHGIFRGVFHFHFYIYSFSKIRGF